MPRRMGARESGALSLFEQDRPKTLSEEMQQAAVEALADLLLEALNPENAEGEGDEREADA